MQDLSLTNLLFCDKFINLNQKCFVHIHISYEFLPILAKNK